MSKLLPFDRLARLLLQKDDGQPLVMQVTMTYDQPTADEPPDVHIDVEGLAKELAEYDRDIQERLRRAALRAIEEELAAIRAERADDQDGGGN